MYRFRDKKDALRALKSMQGVELDGHKLELKLSNKKGVSNKKSHTKRKAAAGEATTKLLVKNLAFEANVKELRELFSTFGQIKRARLPRKFDGGHRGFAFIDFVTKQEAKNAFDSLQDSHLYGRHLVIEWAKEDGDLSDLREKTIKQYTTQSEGSGRVKRRKKDDDGMDEIDAIMKSGRNA